MCWIIDIRKNILTSNIWKFATKSSFGCVTTKMTEFEEGCTWNKKTSTKDIYEINMTQFSIDTKAASVSFSEIW